MVVHAERAPSLTVAGDALRRDAVELPGAMRWVGAPGAFGPSRPWHRRGVARPSGSPGAIAEMGAVRTRPPQRDRAQGASHPSRRATPRAARTVGVPTPSSQREESPSSAPTQEWGLTRRRRLRSVPVSGADAPRTDEDLTDELPPTKSCAKPWRCFRYGLIADVLRLPPGSREIRRTLHEKAQRTYTIPGTRRTRVALETMRDWLSVYRTGGFEALYPKTRADRGRPRRMPPEVAELLISLKDRAARAVGQSAHRRRPQARHRPPACPLDRAPAALGVRACSTNAPVSPSPPTGDGSPSATPASCG